MPAAGSDRQAVPVVALPTEVGGCEAAAEGLAHRHHGGQPADAIWLACDAPPMPTDPAQVTSDPSSWSSNLIEHRRIG